MDRMRLVHMDSLSCEPILRRMPNGELLIVGQIGDVTEPAPLNRVYTFHSGDNGDTWKKGGSVWPEDGRAVYLTEVTLIDGVVRVYLTIHNGGFINWETRVVASDDNGYTWRDEGPAPCFPDYCFLRGQIRLRSGALLMAYQYYPVSREENDRVAALPGARFPMLNIDRVESGVMESRDNGKTWTRYPGVYSYFGGDTGRSWVWSEPTIYEQENGTISMLIRVNNTGYLWRSDSTDGGKTFSEPVQTDIPNPSNKPKLLALPGGAVALIHTPNSKCGMRERNPLAVWYSYDNMVTWPRKHVISDFPGCFCYPDGVAEDGHILFAIEFNRHEILFVDHEIQA